MEEESRKQYIYIHGCLSTFLFIYLIVSISLIALCVRGNVAIYTHYRLNHKIKELMMRSELMTFHCFKDTSIPVNHLPMRRCRKLQTKTNGPTMRTTQ